MKRINYLIVAMLMAFTMVGCQNFVTFEDLDKRDYATKDWVKEYVADQLKSVNKRIDELPTSSGLTDEEKEEIKADLEAYCLENCKGEKGDKGDKGDTGDATVDLADVKERLATVESKISKVEETLETYKNVLTDIDNLEKGLANKLDKSFVGNYESLAKALETVKVDLTNYVTSDKIKNWITKEDLGFESGDTIDNVKERLATVESKISKVESILEIENDVSKKLADLETKVDGKVDSTVFNTFKGDYESLSSMIESLNLADYLTSTDLGYNSKDEVKVDNVADSLKDLKKRVDKLETILDVKNATDETINKVRLAIASIDTKASEITTLRNELDDLKTTVDNETSRLVKQIGNANSNIDLLEVRIKELEGAKGYYEYYCDLQIKNLANLYATKESLDAKANKTDLDSYAEKSELIGLVSEYIAIEIGKATKDTKDTIADTYATKTELASKLDASAINVTDITSRLAILETVEKVSYTTEAGGGDYWAWAYYKVGNSGFYIGYEQVGFNKNPTFDEIISEGKNSSNLVVTTTPTLN